MRYIIYEDKIIISYAHPVSIIRYAYMHYALMDALREILKINVDKNNNILEVSPKKLDLYQT